MTTLLPFQKAFAALCSLALLLTLSACDDDGTPGPPEPVEVSTVEYINGRSDLDALSSALQAADLISTLEGDGPFTVFAPTNDALAGLNVDGLAAEDGLNDVELLSDILLTHVIAGEAITANGISDGGTATTESGATITFSVSDGGVQLSVGGATATVQTTDLETTNGVIHIIDDVLIGNTTTAERAKATPATETLATAVGAAGLESTLDGDGSFTVFAPVNSAFDAIDADELTGDADLLDEVLTYHVVSGQALASGDIAEGESSVETIDGADLTINKAADGTVTVNGATVTTADIQTTNGVIHLIDGVLLETLDIANYAALTPDVETLVGAVDAAGLTSALADENNTFTVFAPVNSAFDAIDADELTGDAALLSRVLNYHVVQGQSVPLTGAGLSDGATLATNDTGQNLTVSVEDDSITAVNGFEIAGTVEVENGTIHLLGDVLLQSANIAQRATLDPNLSALTDAATTAGLASGAGTLGDDGSTFTVFAPPNGAFSGLATDTFTGDDGSQTLAADIISYHAISGAVTAENVPNTDVSSVEGTNLTLRQFADGSVTVNGVPVTTADIQARNGIIHVIDGVLLGSLNIAQRATVEPSLSTLVAAVDAADASVANTLTDEGSEYTVFAPTNDAFSALDVDEITGDQDLVTDLLLNHVTGGSVASGDITNGQEAETLEQAADGDSDRLTFTVTSDGSVSVNGIPVSTADIQTVNGVVHVIDGVLLSELNATQRVVADPAFSTLQTALEAAGEASTLEGAGPFTVFAPTNDAFVAALDADDSGAVESGELPAAADLSDILLYHVIAGSAVASTDLSDGQTETTATDSPDGNVLTFGVNGGVTVNPDDEAASVVTADVEVDNGIVHVIDTVLIPGDQSSGNGDS
jgi:transforming growth factor-beta-induced protein